MHNCHVFKLPSAFQTPSPCLGNLQLYQPGIIRAESRKLRFPARLLCNWDIATWTRFCQSITCSWTLVWKQATRGDKLWRESILLALVAAEAPSDQGQPAQGFLRVQWATAAAAIFSSGWFRRMVSESLDSTVITCVDSSPQFYELPNILIITSFSG